MQLLTMTNEPTNVVPIKPGMPTGGAPRRLSTDPASPHYSRWHVQRALVTVDGVVVTQVQEFDIDEGWAGCLVVGSDGEFETTDDGNQIKRVRHYGKVVVEYVRGTRFF